MFKLFFSPISNASFKLNFCFSCALITNELNKNASSIAEFFMVFLLIFIPFSKYKYRIGKTINVSKVAVIKPPITTVAKGF